MMDDYGYDYGFRARSAGRGDRARGGWPASWQERGESAWSRPEFNESLGAYWGEASPSIGYDYGWNRGPTDTGGRLDRWRSGQSWSYGAGPADRIKARDLMTENPETVTPDTPLMEVARRMRELDVGIIPVVTDPERGLLKGVITDRDITIRAAAEGKDMKKATAGDAMSAHVSSVHEGASVRDVFSVMKRERVRRVPVTDESGRLVGIIAQADLAVDYAGLDDDREMEVEEVLERISEPARPRPAGARGGSAWSGPRPVYRATANRYDRYDYDLGDRVRSGWDSLKREARDLLQRGYDRGYHRGWR